MTVIRVHKTKDFTVMSNTHLKDTNLSLKAKGLQSVMLALSEDWEYSIQGLVAICKEQETAITSTLNELKEFGYVRVEKKYPTKENGGRIEYIYNIYENPTQDIGKQDLENLGVECQGIENQAQLNTKQQSTKKLSTKELKEKYKRENPEVFEIIDFWNERSIEDRCEGGKCSITAIKKALSKYTADEIKTAIDRYKQVINDQSYYYNYSWKIELFLTRKGGITEFFDGGNKWQNYLAEKNRKTARKPTTEYDVYDEF